MIGFAGGDPGEARTLDPLIKSQLLYQLSYGVIFQFATLISFSVRDVVFLNCDAKVRTILHSTKFFELFFRQSSIFLKKVLFTGSP